jgi:hypothetical protein
VASGITGVVIAFERTQIQIRCARINVQSSYKIAIREEVCLRFSKAIDKAENNPNLRPEIREQLMKELREDLNDVLIQIKKEFISSCL